MTDTQELRIISHHELVQTCMSLNSDGYRIMQICATRIPDGFELTYTFARDYEFLGIRFTIAEEDEILSISMIYAPAFLYENEMKDLFGIKIKLISTDYEGNFYRLEKKTPFKNKE